MVDIASYERSLLLFGGVSRRIARPRFGRIMVIVAPLRKVVCEFEAGRVGRSILEVYDHKLLVSVLRKQERGWSLSGRGWLRDQPQNVAVLRLGSVSLERYEEYGKWDSHRYEQRPDC